MNSAESGLRISVLGQLEARERLDLDKERTHFLIARVEPTKSTRSTTERDIPKLTRVV